MQIQDTSTRSGPVRAVIVVWLLAGVFAMHGLTGNHEAVMAQTHAAHPVAAIAPNTRQVAQQHSLQSVHRMPAANLPAIAPLRAPMSVDAMPSSGTAAYTAHHGHRHAMGDVCLAMLAALAMAILGALAVRGLRATHPVLRVCPALVAIAAGPSPPWLQPTLSKLCVLRT
jgi:hypothetical protein